MPKALDILGFGSVAVDDIMYVDQPLGTGKGRVTGRSIAHGGNVATALCAAASLGARAGYVGWLSNLPEYEFVAKAFENDNVDVSHASLADDAPPIRSLVVVDTQGERFIAYEDNTRCDAPAGLDAATLKQAQVLLIDSYASSSLPVVADARALGLQIVADLEWSTGRATDKLIAMVDHLVLPWNFASKLTGKNEPSEILADLWSPERSGVVLTKGEEGSFVRQKDDPVVWHQPAHSVQVLDTTGCGDCFHGAYAAALVLEKTPLECTTYASAAAAISATGSGGRGALPTHEACVSLMTSDDAPTASPLASLERCLEI